jgi:hypothetical protein
MPNGRLATQHKDEGLQFIPVSPPFLAATAQHRAQLQPSARLSAGKTVVFGGAAVNDQAIQGPNGLASTHMSSQVRIYRNLMSNKHACANQRTLAHPLHAFFTPPLRADY